MENKILDINFLKKFILIYDTLDGYNNQQFKSLYKDFEFIIDFINKKNNFKNEEIDEKNLFISPINYLIIFTKKLLKNRNYYIVKPSIAINNSNIYSSLNLIGNGSIVFIDNNLSLDNFKLLIKTINNKDLNMVYLSKIIEE